MELDKVQVTPIRSGSLIAGHENPGGSPKLRWMGQRARILELRGLLLRSDAKSTINTIIALQASRNTFDVTLRAHGFTWLNRAGHYITSFSCELVRDGQSRRSPEGPIPYHPQTLHLNAIDS